MKERGRRTLPRLSLLAVLCAAAIAIGCGGAIGTSDSGAGPQASPTPTPTPTSTPLPTPTPQSTFLLGLSTSAVSFGTVPIGGTLSKRVTISNRGTGDVDLTEINVTGIGFTVSGPLVPMQVPAGENVVFTIVFTPQSAGSDSGRVSFISNASNSPNVVNVSGTGTEPNSHSVDLSWKASTSVVVGYYIYRGTQTGGPYLLVNQAVEPATTYTDLEVQAGTTYYYVVTAADSAGAESVYSNEASAVVPSP